MLASHLVAFLQKFKKFKEFLRNSLNFLQFSAKFSNTFHKKLAKFSNNSRKMRANFPQKFAQPKKLTQKTCSAHSKSLPKKLALLTQKAYPKSLLCSLKKLSQKKARSLKKVRLKSSLQKLTARAALHTAGWCLPAPSRKSHFGLKCCILRNSRFPQQNPHLL